MASKEQSCDRRTKVDADLEGQPAAGPVDTAPEGRALAQRTATPLPRREQCTVRDVTPAEGHGCLAVEHTADSTQPSRTTGRLPGLLAPPGAMNAGIRFDGVGAGDSRRNRQGIDRGNKSVPRMPSGVDRDCGGTSTHVGRAVSWPQALAGGFHQMLSLEVRYDHVRARLQLVFERVVDAPVILSRGPGGTRARKVHLAAVVVRAGFIAAVCKEPAAATLPGAREDYKGH